LGSGACELKVDSLSPSGAHLAVSIAEGSGASKAWLVRVIDMHGRRALAVETRISDGESVSWAPVLPEYDRIGRQDALLAGKNLITLDPPTVVPLGGGACWLR